MRFKDQSILDVKAYFKPRETFQYTHFTSCHPQSRKNGFVKGEALRILRTNSSEDTFEENISKLEKKRKLQNRGYPRNLVEKLLSEIKFTGRGSVLKANNKTQKDILPCGDTISAICVKLKRSFTPKMAFNSKSTPTSQNCLKNHCSFHTKKEHS